VTEHAKIFQFIELLLELDKFIVTVQGEATFMLRRLYRAHIYFCLKGTKGAIVAGNCWIKHGVVLDQKVTELGCDVWREEVVGV